MKIFIIFLLMMNISFAQTKSDDKTSLLYSCNACHGEKGISPNEEWPNLAGQKKKYLFGELKKFKSGERVNPLMGPVAAMLTEEDMEKLAEYFSKMGAP